MEPKNATGLLSTYRNDSSSSMNGNEHVNLVSTLNDLNESISNNLNNPACMSNTLDSITQDKYCGMLLRSLVMIKFETFVIRFIIFFNYFADDFNRSKYFCEHCQFVCNTKLKLKLHLKKLHKVYVNNIHECGTSQCQLIILAIQNS